MRRASVLVTLTLTLGSCHSYQQFLADTYGNVTFHTTDLGIPVAPNGFPVDPLEFENLTLAIFDQWQGALDAEGYVCDVYQEPWWSAYVSFQPYPFTWDGVGHDGRLLAGLMVPIHFAIVVGYLEPLMNTALGHEYGHAILFTCGMPYQENALKWWAERYGLPY